ncbi:FAD-dependent monooxygenase [Nocardia bovistercoris]|uniref:FAD-dependent monooxygenase n=1 Tax=Nocardia bovistercoris TaxID=2785916 RepID=A0A931ICY5_9NOCA|nr:FAD-dependent monooxygenase [Nocardia bovistercoris]MBH0779139.1 FAD-dependent monooxygenase [Nocardia bovistercoris]
MNATPRVLVSGGGIGGNAVAALLLRAGIPVTVVERATAPRPGGQAVDLRGPSREVAERMGIMPAIQRRRLDERGMLYLDDHGRENLRVPAELFDGKGGVADIEITRGDLNAILLDAVAETGGADYRYGESITDIAQDPAGANVSFASGATERYDVVIGADGLHSTTRALVFGPEPEFTTYLGGYMSFCTMDTPEGIQPHWFSMQSLVGATGLGFRPDADPSTCKALVIIRAPADPTLRRDTTAQQNLIRTRLSGGGALADLVVAAMSTTEDFYFDELSRVDLPHWSRERVTLLGDAGYCGSPLSGHGTAMALVGAYLLAGEIIAAPGDPVRALATYEQRMRPFVTTARRLPPGGLRAMTPNSRAGIMAGRAVSRLMTSRFMKPLVMRMLPESETETYRLPEYAA